MTRWHEGRLMSFDTEGTGVDTSEDRFVSVAVVHLAPGQRPSTITWLTDPGLPVPDDAAAIHGWTTDKLKAALNGAPAIRFHRGRGMPMTRDGALGEIAGHLGMAMGIGTPVIVANAPFDLSMLEVELRRNGIDTLTDRLSEIRGVIDPMVIDKHLDPYRKSCYRAPGCRPEDKHHECGGCRGSKGYRCGGCGATDRTLTSLCRHYGVVHTGAHDAAADAIAAARLVTRLVSLFPEIGALSLGSLHAHQVTWKKAQADSLRDWWRRQGDERWAEVDGDWPLRRTPVPATAGAGVA